MDFIEPLTLVEAADAMRERGDSARYLGGGTALVLLLKMGLVAPETLISLRRVSDVPGWRDITLDSGYLRIGGGVTLDRVARSPVVRKVAPGLARAAAVVGNLRIRNAATMGGLMAEADYASDPPSALVSLNATVSVSEGRQARDVPAAAFIQDFYTTALVDEEVVTGVAMPVTASNCASVYRKFCARSAEDRPCVGTAVACEMIDGAIAHLKVVVGAVAGKPQWLGELTNGYRGRTLTKAVAAEIGQAYAEAIDPIHDARGTAWYRRQVIRAEVTRAVLTLIENWDDNAHIVVDRDR